MWADVIARVRLHSVAQTTEYEILEEPLGYVIALEFTFEVLEYVKDGGGNRLTGLAYDGDVQFETQHGASTLGTDFLSTRDGQWDDREAIVFLRNDFVLESTRQPDRYWLGLLRFDGFEYYSIASRHYQPWLPEALPPPAAAGQPGGTVTGQAAGTASGSNEQRFHHRRAQLHHDQ